MNVLFIYSENLFNQLFRPGRSLYCTIFSFRVNLIISIVSPGPSDTDNDGYFSFKLLAMSVA